MWRRDVPFLTAPLSASYSDVVGDRLANVHLHPTEALRRSDAATSYSSLTLQLTLCSA